MTISDIYSGKQLGVNLAQVFASLDADGNGTLSKKELKAGLAGIKIYLPQATVDRIFRTIDTSRNGLLEYDEFCTFLNAHVN